MRGGNGERFWCLIGITMAMALVPQGAVAQVLERHIPPRPESAPVEIAPGPVELEAADDEPLGVDLAALVFLGPHDPLAGRAISTFDASRVPRLDDSAFRERMSRFAGQSISLRRVVVTAEMRISDTRCGNRSA
jgi:hypothetical protein